MKKVLGLDLGTTSIGWALVNQAEHENEQSSIVKVGVRVNPLSVDEKGNFEKGKAITTNADRTLSRGMRRSLQRYKLRRDRLIEVFRREGWIDGVSLLYESGPGSTFETLRLRAQSASSEICLSELSRVLLNINKKRGYKSSRKENSAEDGHLINGIEVAKKLYKEGLTPGQYSLRLILDGVKLKPDYYRSDLENEYLRIWNAQKLFYPDILTDDFMNQLSSLGRNGVSKVFLGKYGIFTADNKGKDKKTVAYQWRADALREKVAKEVLAYVLGDLKEEIKNSSGYLGSISDRSKELFFNKQTVGQYLYERVKSDPFFTTKNKVFYRQDYLDEFETIWECQKVFHKELTDNLKQEIRDLIIFYQRPLKSQKGLIAFCEFESREVRRVVDGKEKVRRQGCRVAPRASLLFQEFKIWSILNNLRITDRNSGDSFSLSVDQMADLARELTARPKMSASEVLKFFGRSGRKYELNYKTVEGNSTMSALYDKYLEIVNVSGHGEYDATKLPFDEVDTIVRQVFSGLGFKTDFLSFDPSLGKNEYESQPSFKLWHLLYSYEGDNSNTGDQSLINKISEICGMPEEYARIISKATFIDDYASLSHKAMNRVLPFLKGGNTYDDACKYAGYNHSHTITKEENLQRTLKDRLEVLPKGALRNPVVEKIINQMINVVNQVADAYGKPDEIHIELARELKQSQKERQKAVSDIAARTRDNEAIEKILKEEFGFVNVSRNDVVRYRLYEELKTNGYKTLYSNKYISRDMLFSKSIDIEHIIPQARLFDDSFSNKTLEYRDINIEKGRETAKDYILNKWGEKRFEAYKTIVNELYDNNIIGKAKRRNLLMSGNEIPEDFVERDLRDSQYIAKKSREILESFVRDVVSTSGEITDRLRKDWQLVDVMKELNLPKYRAVGQTYFEVSNEGKQIERINNWTKRNDHRHHAMDAITIAFTRRSHIQILNNLNASSDKDSEFFAMKNKEMQRGAFVPPIPLAQFRSDAKTALESTLVSIKAKNKVVTRNVNVTRKLDGYNHQLTLTPRGQLHKEQVYGKRDIYEVFYVNIGSKMTADVIEQVASRRQRDALRMRLSLFDGDPKKAFSGKNSFEKNPVYINDAHTLTVPEKVKCVRYKTVFSIRKEVSPDLNLEKVADARIRAILNKRLEAFGGDAKKAFTNLDENPILLGEKKKLKRVKIFENFDLYPVRYKRNRKGDCIDGLDGEMIPNDYVSLSSNHHIAIYRDSAGSLQEAVVPFLTALQRVSAGHPAVDKEYNADLGWTFVFSMKINEMFVFPDIENGFYPNEIDLTNQANYSSISPHLFRVQKLTRSDYFFRHHLETTLDANMKLKDVTWKRISSIKNLEGVIKVRINHIGQIVSVGEYD